MPDFFYIDSEHCLFLFYSTVLLYSHYRYLFPVPLLFLNKKNPNIITYVALIRIPLTCLFVIPQVGIFSEFVAYLRGIMCAKFRGIPPNKIFHGFHVHVYVRYHTCTCTVPDM
jgi:hypothetical protein